MYKPFVIFGFHATETFVNALILKSASNFLTNTLASDHCQAHFDSSDIAGLIAGFFVALPLVLTITHLYYKSDAAQETDSHSPLLDNTADAPGDEETGHNGHNHGHSDGSHGHSHHGHGHSHNGSCDCHTLGDYALIGAPFALLAFGGVNHYLQKLCLSGNTASTIARSIIAGLLGLCSGTGYVKFHTHGSDAPAMKKANPCLKTWFYIAIFIGHFFQGTADADVFFNSLNENNHTADLLEIGFSCLLGALVCFFEGRTEARATAQTLAGTNDYRSNIFSRLALLPASLIHGSLPTIGIISFVDIFLKLFQQDTLSQQLTELGGEYGAFARIGFFVAACTIFTPPNTYGVMNATLPGFNASVNAAKQTFSSLKFCISGGAS